MARPSYNSGDARAKDRLIESFWLLLEDMPCEKMTIREICRRAELNKNSFYYHYTSLDELEDEALNSIMLYELAATIIADPGNAAAALDMLSGHGNVADKLHRISLALCSNASSLQTKIADHIAQTWAAALGVSFDDLTDDDTLLLTFASGGIVNALRHVGAADYGKALTTIGQTGMVELVANKLLQDTAKPAPLS